MRPPSQSETPGPRRGRRAVFERDQHGPDDGGSDEQHAEEQETAAEEHGRKVAIFPPPEAIANDADEPQKGDPGERDQIECQRDLARVCCDPRARRLRFGGDRSPVQPETGQGQQGKSDPAMAAAFGVFNPASVRPSIWLMPSNLFARRSGRLIAFNIITIKPVRNWVRPRKRPGHTLDPCVFVSAIP